MHINGVGSFRPDLCEIPPETVKRARVFVDHFKSCRMEAGDLVQPLERRLFDEDHIKFELGEALIDENKGRANEYEVTFFKSVGITAQDQFMASLIYDWVVDNNSGIVVSL